MHVCNTNVLLVATRSEQQHCDILSKGNRDRVSSTHTRTHIHTNCHGIVKLPGNIYGWKPHRRAALTKHCRI